MHDQMDLLGVGPDSKCPDCGQPYNDEGEDLMYDRRTLNGYALDEVVSSLQKEIRRSHVYEAVYWAREMIRSGFVKYMWRRLFVILSEDIGLADDNAAVVLNALYNSFQAVVDKKAPTIDEAERASLIAVHAVMRLARAPKNREVADINSIVQTKVENKELLEVPEYAKDMHTNAGRRKGLRGNKGLRHFMTEGRFVEPEMEIDGNRYKAELFKLWADLLNDGPGNGKNGKLQDEESQPDHPF